MGQKGMVAMLQAETLQAAVERCLQTQIRVSQAASNNASVVGHPCLRFLFYRRHPEHYHTAKPHSLATMFRFKDGEIAETEIIQILMTAETYGEFKIIELQKEVNYADLQMRGRIDAKAMRNGDRCIVEAKLVQPGVFNKVNRAEDFLQFPDNQWYYHNYFHQLNAYCLGDNCERGIYALKNRLTSAIKFVDHQLDFDRAEQIAQKLKLVNDALKADEVPAPLSNPEICPHCAFFGHCAPPLNFAGEFTPREQLPEDLAEKLRRYRELKPMAQEFEALDEEFKGNLMGIKAIIGEFIISGRWQKRKQFDIPAEVKSQYCTGDVEYWVKSIKWPED
jgi:hypothetical protein